MNNFISIFIDISIKSFIVLALVFIFLPALKRLSAAARHLVWMFTMIALLALPVLSIALPELSLKILPDNKAGKTVSKIVRRSILAVAKPEITDVKAEKVKKEFKKPGKSVFESKSDFKKQKITFGAAIKSTFKNIFTKIKSKSWIFWVTSAWIIGLFIFMLPIIFGLFCVGWITLKSEKINKSSLPYSVLSIVNKFNRKISLRQCCEKSFLTAPTTWGIFRPIILLPENINKYSTDCLRVILLHETAHISRFDWLTQLISRIVCAVYWFNPFIWIANRCLRVEAEKACDNKVINSGFNSSDYANYLLDLVRAIKIRKRFAFATVPMARKSKIESRLRAILNSKINRKGITKFSLVVTLFAIITVVVPLAAVRPAAKTEKKPAGNTIKNILRRSLHAGTTREIRKALVKIKQDAKEKAQISVNLVDYRDENNVLSTLGSIYGIEAVCFNEVLANDCSWWRDLTSANKREENNGMITYYLKVPDEYLDKNYFYRACFPNSESDEGFERGELIRQNNDGYIKITLDAKSSKNRVYFLRPDIVKLVNLSDKAISLKNWEIQANTGSHANEVAKIGVAKRFSDKYGKNYEDTNPTIKPHDYFYLTDDIEIFALEHGDGDNIYGNSSTETIPAFEIPNHNWGCLFRIKGVTNDTIITYDCHFKEGQFSNEIVELFSQGGISNNYFVSAIVTDCGSNYFNINADFDIINKIKKDDTIRLRGFPNKGGYVSYTLLNEYDQVCSRTTRNSHLIKNKNYTIKNAKFSSLKELEKVRNMSSNILNAAESCFILKEIKLEAEEPGAHISGWKPTFSRSESDVSDNRFKFENPGWPAGIWKNQTLKILSGAQKGQTFPIENNTENSITVAGNSTEKEEKLSIKNGDLFSVGPGYSSSMFCATRSGEIGIWEWNNKNLSTNNYSLYIFGLNDTTVTTEFLEENFNAGCDIEVYNYKTKEFDKIRKRGMCGKQDNFNAGQVTPNHISENSDFKIKVTAHSINSKYNLGSKLAWFDCAVLVPTDNLNK